MQPHASKEQSRFRKAPSGYLVPYAGSERLMPKRGKNGASDRARKVQRKALDPKVVEWLLAEIAAWSGEPLSWEALVAKAELRWNYTWSRQGLAKFKVDGRRIILEAFQQRRDQLKGAGSRPVTSAARAKRREQAALMSEIEGLRRDVARLTERLCIWQKNAFLKGLTLEELDAEWHPVDRHQSDPALRRKLGLPTGLRR
ncbi:hypothetical protein [Methylobacterium fujisawaense]|uniref:hypothetical protein n=1 Tax=Methylobacterium fujisawaense TaxID=107400 RepID=UPI00313B163E